MLTFIKIGGSLITDKTVEKTFRKDIMDRIAAQIQALRTELPDETFVIGHGSGSFGHYAARRHGTADGVHTTDDWRGFAEVATAAYELNHYVLASLVNHDLPVWRIQPSASAICKGGEITSMALSTLSTALENGLIPLIHGDVAIDTEKGGTIISTEAIFLYLARHLPVQRIILLGEVAGVYDNNHQLIPKITPDNFEQIADVLGGSRGVDVTGGMYSKVRQMLTLTQDINGLHVHIIDGRQPENLRKLLVERKPIGTHIHS